MAELVTNADDVDVVLETLDEDLSTTGTVLRVNANEFTLSNEQEIGSVSDINSDGPRGLSKGNREYTFDFSIEGDQPDVQEAVTDDDGDALPFAMRAEKPSVDGTGVDWRYSLGLCLADTEELSGTTGEPLGYSVEGMGADYEREI